MLFRSPRQAVAPARRAELSGAVQKPEMLLVWDAARMSDPSSWAPALAALAGGLVGVGGTVAVAMMNHKAAREDRLRQRVEDLAGELLSTCDELWRQEQGVAVAVFSLMNAEGWNTPDPDVVKAYDDQWRETMRAANAATARARDIAGVLSLIRPDLEPAATAYIDACQYRAERWRPTPTREQRQKRDDARAAFLASARAALDT